MCISIVIIFLLFEIRKIDIVVAFRVKWTRGKKYTRQNLYNFISGEGRNISKFDYIFTMKKS